MHCADSYWTDDISSKNEKYFFLKKLLFSTNYLHSFALEVTSKINVTSVSSPTLY